MFVSSDHDAAGCVPEKILLSAVFPKSAVRVIIMFIKSRQTFPAITGTRKPISHQLSGCKKPETAQANLAM